MNKYLYIFILVSFNTFSIEKGYIDYNSNTNFYYVIGNSHESDSIRKEFKKDYYYYSKDLILFYNEEYYRFYFIKGNKIEIDNQNYRRLVNKFREEHQIYNDEIMGRIDFLELFDYLYLNENEFVSIIEYNNNKYNIGIFFLVVMGTIFVILPLLFYLYSRKNKFDLLKRETNILIKKINFILEKNKNGKYDNIVEKNIIEFKKTKIYFYHFLIVDRMNKKIFRIKQKIDVIITNIEKFELEEKANKLIEDLLPILDKEGIEKIEKYKKSSSNLLRDVEYYILSNKEKIELFKERNILLPLLRKSLEFYEKEERLTNVIINLIKDLEEFKLDSLNISNAQNIIKLSKEYVSKLNLSFLIQENCEKIPGIIKETKELLKESHKYLIFKEFEKQYNKCDNNYDVMISNYDFLQENKHYIGDLNMLDKIRGIVDTIFNSYYEIKKIVEEIKIEYKSIINSKNKRDNLNKICFELLDEINKLDTNNEKLLSYKLYLEIGLTDCPTNLFELNKKNNQLIETIYQVKKQLLNLKKK